MFWATKANHKYFLLVSLNNVKQNNLEGILYYKNRL